MISEVFTQESLKQVLIKAMVPQVVKELEALAKIIIQNKISVPISFDPS